MPKLPDREEVYEAAELFRERSMRRGGSLFDPERESLWRGPAVEALMRAFVENPDTGDRSFFEKLEEQLAEVSDDAIQVMGEAFYFHFLVAVPETIRGETKREHIERVLEWMDEPVEIPGRLADTLDSGLVAPGQGFLMFRYEMVGFLLKFAHQWGALSESDRDELLTDPWGFREFTFGVEMQSCATQRHALLHLVHPTTFEPMVSESDKHAVAAHFSTYVDDEASNVDQKLQQVRRGLTEEREESFDWFYADDIEWRWQSDAWEEFLDIAEKLYAWEGFDEAERDYKLRVADAVTAAKAALENEEADWIDELRTAIGHSDNNLTHWSTNRTLESWLDAEPESVREALEELWKQDASLSERLAHFFHVLPEDVGSPSSRVSLASFFLMADGPTAYPVYRYDPFKSAYQLAEFPEPDYSKPVEAYRHALDFMDALIEDLADLGTNLRDRLDAQALVWVMTSYDPGDLEFLDEAERRKFADFRGVSPDEPGAENEGSAAWFGEELFLDEQEFQGYVELLRRRKNVILQGPPGVGKTFMARRLAWQLMGEKDSDRLEMVQFHQSYTYEDFIQGYRPAEGGGFERKKGVFYTFCKRAQRDPESSYVFVIDEINRGNLSKIFGELMMLIEKDKRGREYAVPLQYAESEDDTFYVPKNVHVVGMMNTADRSLAMVDYALRRRFAFVGMEPAFERESFPEFLAENGVSEGLREHIRVRLGELNQTIRNDNNLGPGFCVGHSYFCPRPNDDLAYDAEWFERVVEYDIEPLLREYWFDKPEKVDREVKNLREGLDALE